MKDFYDILVNRFATRKTSIKKHDIDKVLKNLKESKLLEKMYHEYSEKTPFAKNTTYENIIEALEKTKNLIRYQTEFYIKFTSLLLIRHGEDEQNKLGGWSNTALTEQGVVQTARLRQELKDKITRKQDIVIISSDLKRARETTKILFDLNNSSIFDKRLREVNNGDLANLAIEAFLHQYPSIYFDSINYDEKYPNGESPKDYYERVSHCFLEINETYKGRHLIIVAHVSTYGILKSMINGVVWSNKQKYKLNYAEYFEYIQMDE